MQMQFIIFYHWISKNTNKVALYHETNHESDSKLVTIYKHYSYHNVLTIDIHTGTIP